MHRRLGDHLKAALDARSINLHFGTHYTAEDVDAMDELDLQEMLAWIEAQSG